MSVAPHPQSSIDDFALGFRRLPAWIVAIVLLLVVAMAVSTSSELFRVEWLQRVYFATGGFVASGTAIGGLILLVFLAVFRLGGVLPSDVGLGAGKLLPAVMLTFALWLVAVVAVELLANVWAGEIPTLHSHWHEFGGTVLLGVMIGSLLGATIEDLAFRGLLFPQVLLRLERQAIGPRGRLVIALLISQGAFALLHVPARMHAEIYDGVRAVLLDQMLLLVAGMVGVLVLVTTRNLAIWIGIHTLYNAPVPLFGPPPGAERLGSRISIMIVGGLAIACWTWYVGRKGTRWRVPVHPPNALERQPHRSGL
jgi:uncharacterized protein